MSSTTKNFQFVYKSELAERYNICLNTFNVWLKKVEDKIPMYVKTQRRFSQAQVKFLDNVFVHNPNQLTLDIE